MKATIITGIIIFMISNMVVSQNDTAFWNSGMTEIAKPNSSPGWVLLKEETNFIPENFLSQNKIAFGLSHDDSIILIKTQSDELGFTHYKYQQNYKGVKVEGCEYILHVQNGKVISANGKLAHNLDFGVTPSILESTALHTVLNSINATKYGWEVKKNDTAFWSAYPEGELILTRVINNKDFSPNNFKLAYRFIIVGVEPYYSKNAVYVDTKTNEIIKKNNLLKHYHCNCCGGSAQTLYNGLQAITTRHHLSNYILKDNCRGNGIHTTSISFSDPEKEVKNNSNTWGTNDQIYTSAHWAAEMTYDYFLNQHSRNSYDNAGAEILIKVLDNNDPGNIEWNGSYIKLVNGVGSSDFNASVCLDVIGHEFTHAIIESEGKLNDGTEAGALNESFSDIFGTMIDFEYSAGDYELGEEFVITANINLLNQYRRSMSNPNTFNDPDTYEGDFWDPTGEVHTNTGVQNFWFFLLSEGSNGIAVNDNGDSYNVSGIGRNNAARIAYRNLIHYLTSSSDYTDAKNGSIWAAIDLYGDCSNEVLQTINAWNAVGVTSAGGFGANIVVDCGMIAYGLLLNSNYFAKAIDNLSSNCDISTINNTFPVTLGLPVTFSAGERISLLPGFRSGTNFRAFLDPCLAGSNKTGNNDHGNNNTPIQYEDATPEKPEPLILTATPNPKQQTVTAEWTATALSAYDYFTVERSPTGSDFELVVNMPGEGGISQTLRYEAIDEKPLYGISHYRVKQTGESGDFRFSNIATVKLLPPLAFSVRPNPATYFVEITFGKIEKGTVFVLTPEYDARLYIFTAAGEQAYEKSFNGTFYKYSIDISGFSSGLYFVTLVANDQLYKGKFVRVESENK